MPNTFPSSYKKIPPPTRQPDTGVRLQKILAISGVASRRAVEAYIANGRIRVNGSPAALGMKVSARDQVSLDGKALTLRWQACPPRIVLYHKPAGELVTRCDPQKRQTVFDRLPACADSQWMTIGRLDYHSSGLLIVTNSGDFAHRMMHPRFEIEREYAVRIFGRLRKEQERALCQGVELDDGFARAAALYAQGGEGKNHWYRIILREGRNREVRRLFEFFGLTVNRLIRTRFGTLILPKTLPCGQCYELSRAETQAAFLHNLRPCDAHGFEGEKKRNGNDLRR